ncbi:DUF4345 family protein [Nonomuraea sp. NPDC003201]
MSLGRVSSGALLLSGMAGVLMPESVGANLKIDASEARGRAEIRAGLGGTFAALGGWALVRDTPQANAAVAVTWLGAAAVRLAALAVDRPRTDRSYWAYLGLELTLGGAALLAARTQQFTDDPGAGRL